MELKCPIIIIFSILCFAESTEKEGAFQYEVSEESEILYRPDFETGKLNSPVGNEVNQESDAEEMISNLGETLDRCHMKLVETAKLSKVMIRKFMNEVILSGSSADQIDDIIGKDPLQFPFQDEFKEYEEESGARSKRSTNKNVWETLHEVISVIDDACDDLPIMIIRSDEGSFFGPDNHTETVLERIIRALTRWTEKWTHLVRISAASFIDKCLEEPVCEKNLLIITSIIRFSVERARQLQNPEIPQLDVHPILSASQIMDSLDLQQWLPDVSGLDEDSTSRLRAKLMKMVDTLGGFAGFNEREEYHDAILGEENEEDDEKESIPDADEIEEESEDSLRMQKILAAAINVLRFPWEEQDPSKVTVSIDSSTVLRSVPRTFLSFALESQIMHKPSEKFDPRSQKLRNLLQPLKTAVFRLGGSSANFLTFNPTIDDGEEINPSVSNRGHFKSIGKDDINSEEVIEKTLNNGKEPLKLTKVHPKHRKTDTVQEKKFVNPEENTKIQKNHPKYHKIEKENDLHQKIDGHPRYGPLYSMEDSRAHYNGATGSPYDNPKHPKFQVHQSQGLHECHGRKKFEKFTMTGGEMEALIDLCSSMNWTLLFDLNQFSRDSQGEWDPTNARQILQFTKEKNADVIWQVGNEPNNYAHKFNFSITGRAMVNDVQTLRKELHGEDTWLQMLAGRLGLAGDDDVIEVVGPDVTRPKHFSGGSLESGIESTLFLQDFLSAGRDLVDAISWHQYYVCGRTATAEDFTSPDVLDLFVKQLKVIREIRDNLSPSTPIWITETGSAYGGGAPGLSDAFAGTFLWLDKLGVAARDGVDVVARQSLYGGHYAMLDQNYDPNPDFWISAIFKQIVGQKVLQVQMLGNKENLRLYAHCLNEEYIFYQQGGMVLYGVNTGPESVDIQLINAATSPNYLLQYLFSPENGDLASRSVLLNGFPLSATPEGILPPLEPMPLPDDKFSFPGHSVGFWVIQGMNAQVCI